MPFHPTDIPGLLVFEPRVLEDHRGYFFESYNQQTCEAEGVHYRFIQDNQARSRYGVIRGLHYQLHPSAQVKFVRVLQGTILDVAVDIRQGSPTYGRHVAIELSAENRKQLLIPAGFAHGYSVLSESAEVFYKCDAFYDKATEAGIYYADAALQIDWRIPEPDRIVSEKDLQQPRWSECRNNFIFS